MSDPFYCSFCAKSNHEVEKLIAGPTAFICNECVDLCVDLGSTPVQRCGSCKYWELSGYAQMNGMESGVGGYHTDGSVSNCRRNAPQELRQDRYPSANVVWPQTNKTDWCGDWLRRPASVDTRPKDGDGEAAPLASGAVHEVETPKHD